MIRKTNRILILAPVIAALLVVLPGCQTTAQKQDDENSPIEISASTWNGDSQRGGQVLINVAVLNQSDKVILVSSVDIGTARSTSRKEIEPGQTAEFAVWLENTDSNNSATGVLSIAVSYEIDGVPKLKTFVYYPDQTRRR
ncbi:MAG: hypothetical protein ABI718_01360 [Acidobacteriota bacterium]